MTTRPKTQDHKKSKKAPFPVEIDGTTYELAMPKGGLLRSVRRLDPMDMMFTLFEECSPDLELDDDGKPTEPRTSPFLAALDDLDTDDVADIFGDWMGTMGGGDAGNSGGSST